MKQSFVHFRVRSHYSLLESALSVSDIVDIAVKHAMPAIGLCDRGSLSGVPEFTQKALEKGIQPIIGCDMSLRVGDSLHSLPLWVAQEAGWCHLVRLVNMAQDRYEESGDAYITIEDLADHHEGLVASSGNIGTHDGLLPGKRAEDLLQSLAALFKDRFHIEISRHGDSGEEASLAFRVACADRHDWPLLATNHCLFAEASMRPAYEVLRCIATQKAISDEDRERISDRHDLCSATDMRQRFADLPDACDNTSILAQRCHWYPLVQSPKLPPFPCPEGSDEKTELTRWAEAGLTERLQGQLESRGPSLDKEKLQGQGQSLDKEKLEEQGQSLDISDERSYRERLVYELGVICQMGFAGYFLIVADFVRWSKERSIPVGPGRGSGAGSAVAWALGITQLDPIRHGLFFERFLNPERISMPDFDIDFCQERRDEVIEYLRQKYGADKVAHIITFGTLKARAVLRDVGRVLRLPYGKVDEICKLIPADPAHPVTLNQALEGEPELRRRRKDDEEIERMMDIAMRLEGLYRHASTHAAGIVIGGADMRDQVPLVCDQKGHRATQFSMKHVDYAGLVKFDLLGLKTLTVLARTLDMVRRDGGSVDLDSIPLDDADTYLPLGEGRTTGVFQLESTGMRDVLKGLKPDRFADIVAVVALYRPGPMDNIPSYIARKHGKEKIRYLDPRFEGILEETYGIIIYQEQVMEIARVLSGFSLSRADLLRQAMGKKNREVMAAQQRDFIAGALARGVEKDVAAHIFEEVRKFAGYGFNKSHAASYALIAYWTAWLKTHWPVQFLAASMSMDLNNTDKLNVFREEAGQMGITLAPPDINHSQTLFSVGEKISDGVDKGKQSILYGLAAVRNVGRQAADALIEVRDKEGVFADLADFVCRIDGKAINKRMLESLAAAGAFDSIEANRRKVHDGAERIVREANAHHADDHQESLFDRDVQARHMVFDDAEAWGQTSMLEKEFTALGFYLSAHPLDAYSDILQECGVVESTVMRDPSRDRAAARSFIMAGSVIKIRELHSRRDQRRFAFVQLADRSSVFEIGVFAEVLSRRRSIIETGAVLLVQIQMTKVDAGFRLNARDLLPIEALKTTQAEGLTIHLKDATGIRDLQQWMQANADGKTWLRVRLFPDGQAPMLFQLPHRVHAGREKIETLRARTSIGGIEEHIELPFVLKSENFEGRKA